MAEPVEEADVGGPDLAASGSDGLAAALIAALGRRGDGGKADPEFEAFLHDQRGLINLQTEHLHEQRAVILSNLKLRRVNEWMKAALQALTMLVGLGVVIALAVMAWQAHEDHGVSIEAFLVPPDLAQRGLTGQAVAREVLDRLSELQAKTVTGRPASTYANDWGDDIKVEIPETGVSIGELNRYLRDWLGSETRISGEVVSTPAGLAVTVRAGDAPGRRIEGPEANIDKLIGQAAETVYAETQPYRYAVYLGSSGRTADAIAAFTRLAQSGAPEDRAWAYAGWASLLQHEGRLREAVQVGERALRLNPRLEPAYFVVGNSLWSLGRDEEALAVVRQELPLMESRREIGLSAAGQVDRLNAVRAVEAEIVANLRAAIPLMARAERENFEGDPQAFVPHVARLLAEDHDVAGSVRLVAQYPDEWDTAWMFYRYADVDDWATLARKPDAALAGPHKQLPEDVKATGAAWIIGGAYAHAGRLAEATTWLQGSARDCYECLLARAVLAEAKGDRAGADRWYAAAVQQGPSLPQADTQWGEALLKRGSVDAAITKLKDAHRISPHYADPLELWGEALIKMGDYTAAIGKFAEANKDAPKWGRNHMEWGEALMLSGRYAEARAQYQTANGLDLSVGDRAALNVLLARTTKGPLHG